MSLTSKLVLLGEIAFLTLTSCVTNDDNSSPIIQSDQMSNTITSSAYMSSKGLIQAKAVKANATLYGNLAILAGIYAGTVTITIDRDKDDKEYSGPYFKLSGFYDQNTHPEALEKALKEADINGDGIPTSQEGRKALVNECKKYIKKHNLRLR